MEGRVSGREGKRKGGRVRRRYKERKTLTHSIEARAAIVRVES